MPWQVRKADVDYFRKELWKDVRPFPTPVDVNLFSKDCLTADAADVEAQVLDALSAALEPGAVPKLHAVVGSVVHMERIRGARLYDLIRHLRRIVVEEGSPVASATERLLLERAINRVTEVQLALADLAPDLPQDPYPIEMKITSLLELFVRVMGISVASDRWRIELEELSEYWIRRCTMIPFRDATAKNMFVADERLALGFDDDADRSQRRATAQLLAQEPAEYWSTVPFVDVDFSSVIHRTSIEDDPISLCCHEWTFGVMPMAPESFVLSGKLGTPDPLRAAVTLFVRYLRFGGRKLAYRIINSQGSSVRFAFDDPMFYFINLPRWCAELCPQFADTFPNLVALVEAISYQAAAATQADLELLAVDQLRRFYPVGHYWQQTPSEVQ